MLGRSQSPERPQEQPRQRDPVRLPAAGSVRRRPPEARSLWKRRGMEVQLREPGPEGRRPGGWDFALGSLGGLELVSAHFGPQLLH